MNDTDNTNPHDFDDDMLQAVNKLSGEMYDCFFNFLADYQFGLNPAEKLWVLDKVMADMKAVTLDPDNI